MLGLGYLGFRFLLTDEICCRMNVFVPSSSASSFHKHHLRKLPSAGANLPRRQGGDGGGWNDRIARVLYGARRGDDLIVRLVRVVVIVVHGARGGQAFRVFAASSTR